MRLCKAVTMTLDTYNDACSDNEEKTKKPKTKQVGHEYAKQQMVNASGSSNKFSFQLLSDKCGTHILPDASGRKTSESFIRKDGDGGIERKTEARSSERSSNKYIKPIKHPLSQTHTMTLIKNKNQ